MELVEATADDLDALVDRWYSLAKSMEAYDDLNQPVFTDGDDVPKDSFHNHLDAEDITDYLIVHENETIGYVILREGRHPSRQYSDYLRIVDLYIDEDRRNHGHGTAVIERVKEKWLATEAATNSKYLVSGKIKIRDGSTGIRISERSKSNTCSHCIDHIQ